MEGGGEAVVASLLTPHPLDNGLRLDSFLQLSRARQSVWKFWPIEMILAPDVCS